eukprot:jgi/Psemu1/3368/gm1.3368_g
MPLEKMKIGDLVKHPASKIGDRWMRLGEDEFRGLFQGIKKRRTEGMDVLDWIPWADPYQTRIMAGGDRLIYDVNVTTHTASMEIMKLHWNSVVSTPRAKYCTRDISNMCLCSSLEDPEYAHQLETLAHNGYVYVNIKKAWYGLKQLGKLHMMTWWPICTRPLEQRDYSYSGTFLSFTLAVDNFGIKYTKQEDVNHLVECTHKKYPFKVDWEWDYVKQVIEASMDGYVEQALKEFKYERPKQVNRGPSRHFLFQAWAIDNMMLHAFNGIASAKDTQARTHKATMPFLNYAANHLNGSIIDRASKMVLQDDINAAYLVSNRARKRVGGCHYLVDKDGKAFNNKPILVLIKTIKNSVHHCTAGFTRETVPNQAGSSTALNMAALVGMLTGTIKQKRSKATDMCFCWLKDRANKQGQ